MRSRKSDNPEALIARSTPTFRKKEPNCSVKCPINAWATQPQLPVSPTRHPLAPPTDSAYDADLAESRMRMIFPTWVSPWRRSRSTLDLPLHLPVPTASSIFQTTSPLRFRKTDVGLHGTITPLPMRGDSQHGGGSRRRSQCVAGSGSSYGLFRGHWSIFRAYGQRVYLRQCTEDVTEHWLKTGPTYGATHLGYRPLPGHYTTEQMLYERPGQWDEVIREAAALERNSMVNGAHRQTHLGTPTCVRCNPI